MKFTDLSAAFDEMEWLVATTGQSYCVYHGRFHNTYKVSPSGDYKPLDRLIAELNCHNVVGDKIINQSRGDKMRMVKDRKRL